MSMIPAGESDSGTAFGALVVRPEPGNARTAARLRTAGLDVATWPLFAVEPVAWIPPEPSGFDGVLLTSAHAVRHAGSGLAALAGLPVITVGRQTAAAARHAGLEVAVIGDAGVAAVVEAARARGLGRLLHLAGQDHVDSGHAAVVVYRSATLPADQQAFVATARARTVLLHSPRAAARVAALIENVDDRQAIAVAALSHAVLAAAGRGWRNGWVAESPTDAALCYLVQQQAIDHGPAGGDKTA